MIVKDSKKKKITMYINPLPYVCDFMVGQELRQRIDCKVDLDSFYLFFFGATDRLAAISLPIGESMRKKDSLLITTSIWHICQRKIRKLLRESGCFDSFWLLFF